MKNLNKLLLVTFSLLSLSGCAAGSATAGYALRANCADSVSTTAEQQIVDRAKRELRAELAGQNLHP